MSFVRFTPVMRFYWDGLRSITPVMRSYRYVLRSITPVMRFYWDGLRSITPVIRSYRYVLRSITPAVCRIAPNRTACDMLHSYSAVGRDRHSYVLGCRVVIRLCWFTSRLRVSLWRSRRRTKETRKRGGTEETGNGRDGERSRRWGVSALLRDRIGFAVFSAGSTLGLRAPDCAKESSTLWTLFIWVAAWVRFTRRGGCVYNEDLRKHRNNLCPRSVAPTPRRRPDTRRDLPGSNLWPGKSGCTTIISTRSNVQTRAAPKRRGVGFQRAERSGSGTAASLDSLHAAAGLGWRVFAGTARRPA